MFPAPTLSNSLHLSQSLVEVLCYKHMFFSSGHWSINQHDFGVLSSFSLLVEHINIVSLFSLTNSSLPISFYISFLLAIEILCYPFGDSL